MRSFACFRFACIIDTFFPGRQKVSKKRPYMLLRRIPATRFAEFFTSLIFACCSAAGFVNTPAKNSCACPLLAMFAEHRCACGPVVRSGLRSAKSSVLKNYKIAVSEQLTYREANKNFSKFFLSVRIYQLRRLHTTFFTFHSCSHSLRAAYGPFSLL